jgi:hypothetical protein
MAVVRVIGGDAFKRAVELERATNPAFAALYNELDRSDSVFILQEGPADGCDYCFASAKAGISWSPAQEAVWPSVVRVFGPGIHGISVVNTSNRRARADGIGPVAFHELFHLVGLLRRGRMYLHPIDDCTFDQQGVPNTPSQCPGRISP